MWSPVGALPTPLANGALCFTDGFVNPGGADVLMYEPATGDWTLATALSFLDERSMLTAVVGNGPGFPLDGCLVFTGPFVYRTSALSVLLIYRPTPDPAAGAMPGTLTVGFFTAGELVWAPVDPNPWGHGATGPPTLLALDQIYWPGYGFGQVEQGSGGNWFMQWAVHDPLDPWTWTKPPPRSTSVPPSASDRTRESDVARLASNVGSPPQPDPGRNPEVSAGSTTLPDRSPAGTVLVGYFLDQSFWPFLPIGTGQFLTIGAGSATVTGIWPRSGWDNAWAHGTGEAGYGIQDWDVGTCFWSSAQGKVASAAITFSTDGAGWYVFALGAPFRAAPAYGSFIAITAPPPITPDTVVLLPAGESFGTVFTYEPSTESWQRGVKTVAASGVPSVTFTPITGPPLQDPWAWMTGAGPGLYYSPDLGGWFTGTVTPDGVSTTAMLDLTAGADTTTIGRIRDQVAVLLGANIGAELVSDWLDAQMSFWRFATMDGAAAIGEALFGDRAQLTPQPSDNLPLAALLVELCRTVIAMETPLFDDTTDVPLVLLPIRIEAAYLPVGDGWELALRFYPDDVHVDGHDPTLTDAELQTAQAYWTDVFAAGGDPGLTDSAWQRMLRTLRAPRAAWAAGQLTPTNPVPTAPPAAGADPPQPAWPADYIERKAPSARPPQTALLPDHFAVTLINQGVPELVVEGATIPDPLPLSFSTQADGSPGLLDAGSEWLVDLDEAKAVGMAVKIPLDSPEAFDQIIVTGVAARLTDDAAADRLESAMAAHLYTDGLEFLAPLAPTNNTAEVRSAWSSAPAAVAPTEASARRAAYAAGSDQNAAVLAGATGIDGSVALALCDGAEDHYLIGAASMARILWPLWGDAYLDLTARISSDLTYAGGAEEAIAMSAQTRTELSNFVLGSVRGRGPLPVLRVGRQPYGVLPVASLDTWQASDPFELGLVGWLLMLRQYWAAGTESVPRTTLASSGQPDTPDQAVLDLFSREPLSVTAAGRVVGQTALPDPASAATAAPTMFEPATMPGLDHFSLLAWQDLSSPAVTPSPQPAWTCAEAGASPTFENWLGDVALLLDDLALVCGNPDAVWAQPAPVIAETLQAVTQPLPTESLRLARPGGPRSRLASPRRVDHRAGDEAAGADARRDTGRRPARRLRLDRGPQAGHHDDPADHGRCVLDGHERRLRPRTITPTRRNRRRAPLRLPLPPGPDPAAERAGDQLGTRRAAGAVRGRSQLQADAARRMADRRDPRRTVTERDARVSRRAPADRDRRSDRRDRAAPAVPGAGQPARRRVTGRGLDDRRPGLHEGPARPRHRGHGERRRP
jgi:hypothetical protein